MNFYSVFNFHAEIRLYKWEFIQSSSIFLAKRVEIINRVLKRPQKKGMSRSLDIFCH